MPRLGKKTLYLDLDALDKIQAALQRLPGRPSLSSYLNEQLPVMADLLDQMVTAAEQGGLRGMASLLGVAADLEEKRQEIGNLVREDENADKPLAEIVKDIPPKKVRPGRPKKVVKT